MSVLSPGGSTLSPNNLNLLDHDSVQVSLNSVAQVVAEGQGTDENSILAPPSTSVEFVDILDEVAPMSIPVEFKPHSVGSSSDPKVTIEIIDSVAPQSVPAVTGPGAYYNPGYTKYQYKLQMSSDGNPITSYNQSPGSSIDKEPFTIWNPEGQFVSGASSYGPSIQQHPKWPNLHYFSSELDQLPSSANSFHSYTIMPPPPPPPPPLVSPFLQQSQMQGPFAPERKKPDSYNVFLDQSPDTSSPNSSLSILTNSTLDNKNSTATGHEQQVTMHHLSSDGELTILKVGPKEDTNKNEIGDNDKILDENDVNESIINEIETEGDGIGDNDTDIKDDIENVSNSDFSDSLDSPDPKADQTKYIVLQKLPNGGAIDLENMQTYTMEDLASDIQQNNNDNNQKGSNKNLTYDRPRSFLKSLDGELVAAGENQTTDEQIEETTLSPDDQYIPPDQLIISERPPIEPEVYEPIPLSQLEDLEAMPSTNQEEGEQEGPPVYIIYEHDLFHGQEEHEIAENLANLELLKVPANETRDEKLIQELENASNNTNLDTISIEEPIDDNKLEESGHSDVAFTPNADQIGPSELPKVVWTPIPTQDSRTWETPTRKPASPVIGPEWPLDYSKPSTKDSASLDVSEISHLSKVAYVTLTDGSDLSQVNFFRVIQPKKDL